MALLSPCVGTRSFGHGQATHQQLNKDQTRKPHRVSTLLLCMNKFVFFFYYYFNFRANQAVSVRRAVPVLATGFLIMKTDIRVIQRVPNLSFH